MFDSPPRHHLFGSYTSLIEPDRFSTMTPTTCSVLAQACSVLAQDCSSLYEPVRACTVLPLDPHVTATLSSPCSILAQACSDLFEPVRFLHEPARACCTRYLIFFFFISGKLVRFLGFFRSVFVRFMVVKLGVGWI